MSEQETSFAYALVFFLGGALMAALAGLFFADGEAAAAAVCAVIAAIVGVLSAVALVDAVTENDR